MQASSPSLGRGAGLSNMVTCPKVYRQASASRVLTLEYLDGVSLSNLEAVKQYFPEPEVALIASLNTWVGSVLQNDWFHADVHAGTPPRSSAQFGAVH